MIGLIATGIAAELVALDYHAAVHVQLADGRTGLFVVDTAASATVISPGFFKEPGEGAAEVHGAGGSSQMTIANDVELSVDGRTVELPVVVVMNVALEGAEGIDGILGIDVLREGVACIDVPGQRFTWLEHAPDDRPTRFKHARAKLLEAPFWVGDRKVRGILDLGAAKTILNVRGAQGMPREPGETVTGLDGSSLRLGVLEQTECRFSGSEPVACTPRTAAMDVFETLRIEKKPSAIIGFDVLGQQPFVIDAANRKVWWKQCGGPE